MDTDYARDKLKEHMQMKQKGFGGSGARYVFGSRDGFTCASADGTLLSTDDGFSAVVGVKRLDGRRLIRKLYWVERRPKRRQEGTYIL
jgi:hypothetical protein